MTHHTAADLIRLTQPDGSERSPLTRRQRAKQQRNQPLINRLEAEAHHLEQLLDLAAPLIRQQRPDKDTTE